MQPHFANDIIQAMFSTLLHSLWQGVLLASIAGLILSYTKNAGAVLRYKLFSGVLLAFIFISFTTFCYELYSVTNNIPATPNSTIPVAANNIITTEQPQSGFIEKIIVVLKSCENFIVLAWFIIITLKSINLLAGLRAVHRLKHTQVFDAGDYWNRQLKVLAINAGVTKQVALLKSAIAEIPMVLGHLKPVILFPAAALTTLAAEEIEAILLHELAHIRRKDYLVNILQSIAEILFFFNPAVLWISSLIKEERENCCDDIAIKQVKNKKQFIHALVSFQEYNLASKCAPSFSGKRNYLLSRIKRIITNNNKTLNNMEKFFLATGIIVTAFIAVAFTQHKQFYSNTSSIHSQNIALVVNKKDTLPQTINDNESKYSISTSLDGKQYKLVEVNGKVTELYVDDKKIPDDKLSEYSDVINKLQTKLKEDKQKQVKALESQKKALDEQAEVMKAKTLAMNDMMKTKSKINEEIMKEKDVLMKAHAEELQQMMKEKAVMLKDQAEKLQQTMKANDTMMREQAEKLAEIMKEKNVMLTDEAAKQAEMMKDQAVKLQEIMKEKNAMIKEQVEKQTEMLKGKTEQLMQQDLKKQIEQLKQQNEDLKQQLNQKIDSIYNKSKTTEPKGA